MNYSKAMMHIFALFFNIYTLRNIFGIYKYIKYIKTVYKIMYIYTLIIYI